MKILIFKSFLSWFLVGSFLSSFAQIPENLSNEEKIYALSQVWKEADKNFVFFDQVPDLDWDKMYQQYIPKVLATSSTYEFYKVLQTFCSLLKDGHTRVYVPWKLKEVMEVPPPLQTEYINGKVIITGILNDTLIEQGIKKGMEIIEIDGEDVHKYASLHINPYVFYSTEQDRLVQVYEKQLLIGKVDQNVKLKMSDGMIFSVSRGLESKRTYKPAYEFKKLNKETGYLKLNRFYGNKDEDLNQKFDDIFKEINNTKKMIIDVSENDGGNGMYAHYILSHFVNKPFESSRWKTPMYMPAYAAWGRELKWKEFGGQTIQPQEKSKRYLNPLVVIISEKTYSAGEDFVSGFLHTERGTVIGRPTAGTTGQSIVFNLPGKGAFQICSKKDYLSSGQEFVGYGIQPQKYIKKSFSEDHLISEGLKILNQ